MILELLLDALLDSVKMLPFLFAAYWLIEYVEHRHSEGIEKALAGGGRFGFVPGAVLGLLPQCGFSAMAANLYASKVVTLGTLLAVFLATSDEAVPLLIANPEHWRSLALILGIKLAVALAAGFCIDFVFKRLIRACAAATQAAAALWTATSTRNGTASWRRRSSTRCTSFCSFCCSTLFWARWWLWWARRP